jgi:hypothetical protein
VVISSRMTKFYKYVFPTIWFGFLGVVLVVGLFADESRRDPMIFVVPTAMAVFGFFLFRKLVWVLADKVTDGGDHLLVRNHGAEDVIYLSNVINVSSSVATNPPQVTLRLANPGRFGNEVVFSPVQKGFSLNPFRKNEIVEDLVVRVDQARRRGAG